MGQLSLFKSLWNPDDRSVTKQCHGSRLNKGLREKCVTIWEQMRRMNYKISRNKLEIGPY